MTENIENIIAVEIFTKMVNSLEIKLKSKELENEVKYHNKQLNYSLCNDFKQITNVLQNIVDSYYFNYYLVNEYEPIMLSNYKQSIKHNLELINNAKKLIKFIN